MTKLLRSFSAESKREAADLVLEQNRSYIKASRSLGFGESALLRCVDQVQKERQGVTPQSKALTRIAENSGAGSREWIPTTGYRTAQKAQRDTSHFLMHRNNWVRPYQFNGGQAQARAEEILNVLSGIS